jgi:hypothetical protein
MMARLHTRKIIPQTVPDEDFILDYLGDSALDVREFHSIGFCKNKFSAESVPTLEKQTARWRTKWQGAMFFFVWTYQSSDARA